MSAMISDLHRAARWYANHGWHIFPLRPHTKEPFRGIGVYEATNDLAQIDAWWERWPNANIAAHCGGSGFVTLDLDEYKECYGGEDLLTRAMQETITNLTGNGGTHLLYRMPEGKSFGNATQGLPDGIDVRGVGGYIVLPPSIHPDTGRAYAWESDYGPHEIEMLALPPFLEAILDRAQQHTAESVEFENRDLPKPDLTRFNLTTRIVQLVYEGQNAADRSEADQSVITALASRGATNDEILAVFNHYPIGEGKFSESGERYLAFSIGKARAYLNGSAPKQRRQTTDAQPETPPDEPPSPYAALEDRDTEDVFLAASADDEGNAWCVMSAHRHKFIFCPAYGWMVNTGTHWEANGDSEAKVNRAITETLVARRVAAVRAGENYEPIVKASRPSAKNKREARSQFMDLVTVNVEEFDSDPNVLNCKNGVVDLRTGQLVAHQMSNRFSYCLPVEYHPGADASTWTGFLASVVGSYDEIADWLQMACGYSVTGRTNEECLFYIHGPTRSGKGTFFNTFLALLGSPLSRGVEFSIFTKSRDGDSQNFDLAPLRPARFVAASESGKYQTLNEAAVKNITGNDPVTASFKYKMPFTFVPQFKVWLASNHGIRGDVDDDAFWGRVRAVQFPNSFLGSENKDLKREMASREVMTGVLAWLVEGSKRWFHSDSGLVTPWAVQQTTQKQREELDHVQQWLNECVTHKQGNFMPSKTLYQSYEEWCEENGHTPKKAVALGRAMSAKGFEAKLRKVNGIAMRGFDDLILLAKDVVGG